MRHLFATMAAALIFMAGAFAEEATIYGILTRTAAGDGIDSPTGRYYIVKTKHPVTVEMESFEQDKEGNPPVLVRVITNEIQIIVHADDGIPSNMSDADAERHNARLAAMPAAERQRMDAEIEKAEAASERYLKSLVGKQVRVHGETFAPQNWNHRTPVLLDVDLGEGGSIREPAPLAPKGSNERGEP
jgi:hypothetical protein